MLLCGFDIQVSFALSAYKPLIKLHLQEISIQNNGIFYSTLKDILNWKNIGLNYLLVVVLRYKN